MKRTALLFALALGFSCGDSDEAQNEPTPITPTKPPNIIIIYADDMGYGDLNCQNPKIYDSLDS